MQTSKNHFEAKVIFNDETIRRMFRTEFYTYEGMQRLVWLAVAFALVMLALFDPNGGQGALPAGGVRDVRHAGFSKPGGGRGRHHAAGRGREHGQLPDQRRRRGRGERCPHSV